MTQQAAPGLGADEGWGGAGEPDPLVGRVLGGRFVVRSRLARGSMGRVYVAEQLPLGRVCALKVLAPRATSERTSVFAKRFFLEASVVAKLKHPHTVTVFDFGDHEGICYLAMELLEGRTLRRAIADDAPFDEARAARIGRQIARSLREAHGMGVVHRDLKPANVFLVGQGDEADFVKVLDFGLAKPIEGEGEELTTSHRLLGSPRYMAPEQILGGRVDERTDVYALGVVLYEMVAGRPPFQGANPMETMSAHISARPSPIAGASDAFAALVACALAKNPDERFSSMSEMLEALAPLAPAAVSDAPPARTPDGGIPRARFGSSPHVAAAATRPGSSPALALPASPPVLTLPVALPPASPPAIAPPDAITAMHPAVGQARAASASVVPPVSAQTPTSTRAFSFDRSSGLPGPLAIDRRESAPSLSPPLGLLPPAPGLRGGRGRLVASVGGGLAVVFALAGASLYVQTHAQGSRPRLAIASLGAPAGGDASPTSAGAAQPIAALGAANALGAAGPVGGGKTASVTDVTDKMVHIETEPPGASVQLGLLDGPELCPSTPCEVDLGALASEDGGALLYFVRDGFAPISRRVGGARVVVRLTKPSRRAQPSD